MQLSKTIWIASKQKILLVTACVFMTSCDTKNLNSISAERVGGKNVMKVVAGAQDFAILELVKGTSTATATFNKKYTSDIGFVEIGVFKTSECTGTSLITLVKLNDEAKKTLSIGGIDRSAAFLCAWEVSAIDAKIRNAAINNGLDLAGTTSSSTSSTGTAAGKYLRIVKNLSGDQATVGATSLTIGGSALSMKAALYDASGTYLSDATAIWSLSSGSSSPAGDLVPNMTSVSSTAVFTPSVPGNTTISAIYSGTETLVSSSAYTGLVTSDLAGTATTITIVSGDAQSGAVGSTSALPLKVLVKDQFSRPLQGVSISYSILAGGGSMSGTNPATTDANGNVALSLVYGTSIGSNTVKAAVTSNAALFVTFNETGTHGAVTQVSFQTQPASSYANAAFGTQPIVRVLDTNGNVATSASGSISLSAVTGCGGIYGTSSATLVNGVATFSGSGCTTAAGSATISATFGALSATSSTFAVLATPPGACQVNDSYFTTGGGGCKDVSSGLVWSAKSSGVWGVAVWDQATPVGNTATADANDFGRTSDFDSLGFAFQSIGGYPAVPDYTSNIAGLLDLSTSNYCHSLVEGGQSDWRLPTLAEMKMLGIHVNQGGATPPYLHSQINEDLWTSTVVGTQGAYTGWQFRFNLSTQAASVDQAIYTRSFYCVRGNRSMADRLAIQVAGPSKMGINSTQNVASKSFVISIQDSLLNQSTTAGVTVTVSTNVGAVGGTITAATNAFGRAIFNAFTINTLGSQTLTFSAPGFTSVTATVIGTTDPGACVMDDTWFTSTGGGCKDNSTGKVWSLPSASTMTWHDAIWGYVSGTFNLAEPTDGSDSSRTSDYDSDNSQGGSDTSTVNYCHALTEGGQTDWRVPTSAELTTVYRSGAGSNTHFQNFQNNTNYWASTSQNATYAYYWATGSNSISSYLKSSLYNTICVRP